MRVAEEKPPYQIIQLPKTGETPVLGPPATTPAPTTTLNIEALLNQQVFGIPVKWLALGALAFFLMKK